MTVPRSVVPERDNPTPSESVAMMEDIDALKPAMRALVYEYGATIVGAMLDEGYSNAKELDFLLKTWRWRNQEKWLETDYITPRMVELMHDALNSRKG